MIRTSNSRRIMRQPSAVRAQVEILAHALPATVTALAESLVKHPGVRQ